MKKKIGWALGISWMVGMGVVLVQAQMRVTNTSFTSVGPKGVMTGSGQRLQMAKFGVMAVTVSPLRSIVTPLASNTGAVSGELLVYPNPVTGVSESELGYRLSDNVDVEIKIYNMRANLVAKRSIPRGGLGAVAGYNRIPLSWLMSHSNWSGGVYFVLLLDNGKVMGRTKFSVM